MSRSASLHYRDAEVLHNFLLKQWQQRLDNLPINCYRALMTQRFEYVLAARFPEKERSLTRRWLKVAETRDIASVPDPIGAVPLTSEVPENTLDPSTTLYFCGEGRLTKGPRYWADAESLIYSHPGRLQVTTLHWLQWGNVRHLKRIELPAEAWAILAWNDRVMSTPNWLRPLLCRTQPTFPAFAKSPIRYEWPESTCRVLSVSHATQTLDPVYRDLILQFKIDRISMLMPTVHSAGFYFLCFSLWWEYGWTVRLGLFATWIYRSPLSDAILECVSGRYTEATFSAVLQYFGVDLKLIEQYLYGRPHARARATLRITIHLRNNLTTPIPVGAWSADRRLAQTEEWYHRLLDHLDPESLPHSVIKGLAVGYLPSGSTWLQEQLYKGKFDVLSEWGIPLILPSANAFLLPDYQREGSV